MHVCCTRARPMCIRRNGACVLCVRWSLISALHCRPISKFFCNLFYWKWQKTNNFSSTLNSERLKQIKLVKNKLRASDILWKKNQNFAGFSGAHSRKNRPILREKKSKLAEKIGWFHGILAEKIQISKDFQGQILRKIGRFHGKFWGETSPRNNQ